MLGCPLALYANWISDSLLKPVENVAFFILLVDLSTKAEFQE